jgi:hypothetical protein
MLHAQNWKIDLLSFYDILVSHSLHQSKNPTLSLFLQERMSMNCGTSDNMAVEGISSNERCGVYEHTCNQYLL